MTYRETVFATDEVYHVINRTIAGAPLFLNFRDYSRFIDVLSYYRHKNVPMRFSHLLNMTREDQERIIDNLEIEEKPLIEIIAFCLMKNHFHFLLKQLEEGGISLFISKLQNSYAKYFNLKHNRRGSLFQSMFKAIRIESDEQLIHVSRYIHLNPATSYLCNIEDLEKYPWSSLSHYLNLKSSVFVKPNLVLNLFKNSKAYKKFVFDQADYQKELANIKHLLMEG